MFFIVTITNKTVAYFLGLWTLFTHVMKEKDDGDGPVM